MAKESRGVASLYERSIAAKTRLLTGAPKEGFEDFSHVLSFRTCYMAFSSGYSHVSCGKDLFLLKLWSSCPSRLPKFDPGPNSESGLHQARHTPSVRMVSQSKLNCCLLMRSGDQIESKVS
jgi:hypothetical protein